MFVVASSDGVDVAVHEFGGPAGAPPLLLSHATGFHAHCFEPVAEHLARHYRVFALDHRGHGRTAAPPAWVVDWRRFGHDVLAVAEHVAPDGGLIGVGHSMGAAALLMAAHARPGCVERLVLFEPIAFPDDVPAIDMDEHPIVIGARRRRRVFESHEQAVENFRDKPPLSEMTERVLRAYVDHGFRPVDPDDPAAGIELVCSAEIEAGVFVGARHNGVWELLPDVRTPTTVVSGRIDDQQPSDRCLDIAERLPRGSYVQLDHQSHLGPFSHPVEFAELVLDEVGDRVAGARHDHHDRAAPRTS